MFRKTSGGSPLIGYHVYGPGFPGLDPADAEPSTITNLNGVVGLAYISGMVTRTTISTGEKARLPFLGSDMRFMQGFYRGVDGKPRQGSLAPIFWTTPIPNDSVSTNPGAGRATVRVRDVRVTDFHDIGNALFGGGPAPVPAVVTYEVHWAGVDERVNIESPTYGFAGEFVRNSAQMEWSAIRGDYSFVSDPASTSSSIFAELGTERNGSFFPHV